MTTSYIIQERPYTDTKSFAVIFSKERGVESLPISSKKRLQYFVLYQTVEHKNRLSLKHPVEAPMPLLGQSLYCGLYLNELIYRFCKQRDPHPIVFDQYQLSLTQLQKQENISLALRLFELSILKSSGYEIDTSHINTPYVSFSKHDGLIGSHSESAQTIATEHLNAMLYEMQPSPQVKYFLRNILDSLLSTALQSRLFYEKIITS